MFVDIMRRKIFMLSVTIYLFLFSCIHFKEHPLDPTTLKGYFLSSFLRNNSIDQDNNSIDQDNNSIYQEAKGILDDSFGNGSGYVTLNINNYDDFGQSLAIQPDGKILLGGYCYREAITISALLVLIPMALWIQLLEIVAKKYNLSVHLMILDNLLQSNPMEKFYSVVIAIGVAITISASLALIPMALSIILLVLLMVI
jgi:hypothetical protein